MKSIELLINYIYILKKQLNLDIIIYKECRFLENSELAKITEIGKWHTNPYCLKIKENANLQNQCVSLKPAFVRKILKGNGVVKSTCFCGVTEYAIPLVIDGYLVAIVSASAFLGKIEDGRIEALSKSVGLDKESFLKLREKCLSEVHEERMVMNAVEILRDLLFNYINEHTDIPEKIAKSRLKSNIHILKATDYIYKNFTMPIDAAAVANYCHVNVSYLQHLFSDIVGHGISEEIRICRLNYAKELLCTTDYSVKHISILCGFSSPDYFSTVFTKRCGARPLEYRKMQGIKHRPY